MLFCRFSLDFHGDCRGVDEFFVCAQQDSGCAVEYKLHTLCELDDHEHFQKSVAEQFEFQLYDVVHFSGSQCNLKRLGELKILCNS